jgi:hypothetical protein
MKKQRSLANIIILSPVFFYFGLVSYPPFEMELLEPWVNRKATAGTTVIVKQADPKLHATPNSVILTPCLKKLNIVVVSSGIRLPIATTIPVMSQLRPYLLDMLINEGIKNLSATMANTMRK